MNNINFEVACVIVTYNPDVNRLSLLIKSITKQVKKIFIVDNSFSLNFTFENVTIIPLGSNYGIAYAQNIGIKQCLQEGYSYVMLSDQDTIYPENYIEKMIPVFEMFDKIAAVAPLYADKNSAKQNDGFYQNSLFLYSQFFPTNGIHDVFHAIASGKIINTKYLNDIGLMKEDLFIDWVDLEWCWRARQKGYKIIGNADVTISHLLGDKNIDIGFREVGLRSPIRHYYIARNAFFLALRTDSLTIFHRITLFIKSFRYIVGYPILAKPHGENLKYVLLGFWHGIIGKLGKLS